MTTRETAVPGAVLERSTQLLQRLCAISSASGDGEGLTAMAALLANELSALGMVANVTSEAGIDGSSQPVLTSYSPSAGDRCTLLLGHLDTVLPALPPKMDEGRLTGTGALDMKGGFAALVGALLLLRERRQDPPDDLWLVAVPDEEATGAISMRAVRRWGERAHTVLVLEPGGMGDGVETLVTGRRGLTVWRLDARGRAAHSGVAFWDGRSAVAAAAVWAGEVQQMSEEGDGPIVNAGRIVGGDSEFVEGFGEQYRFIGTGERLNIVADRCLVEGEVRYLTVDDRDRVLEAMREAANRVAEEWKVEIDFSAADHIPPVTVSDSSRRMAEHLVAAAARAGWRLELEHNRGGVSFPNFLPDPAAVRVIDGLGPVGCGMHTRDEYVDLQSLRRRIGLIAEALQYVRNNPGNVQG